MNIKVEIPRLPALSSALGSFNPTKVLGEVINNATQYLRDTAKEYIISGKGYSKAPYLTGNMYRGVTSTVVPLRGTIYPTASYAEYVHEGRGSNRNYGRRPFMEDASEDTKPFAEKELKSQVDDELNKIARKVNVGI